MVPSLRRIRARQVPRPFQLSGLALWAVQEGSKGRLDPRFTGVPGRPGGRDSVELKDHARKMLEGTLALQLRYSNRGLLRRGDAEEGVVSADQDVVADGDRCGNDGLAHVVHGKHLELGLDLGDEYLAVDAGVVEFAVGDDR